MKHSKIGDPMQAIESLLLQDEDDKLDSYISGEDQKFDVEEEIKRQNEEEQKKMQALIEETRMLLN